MFWVCSYLYYCYRFDLNLSGSKTDHSGDIAGYDGGGDYDNDNGVRLSSSSGQGRGRRAKSKARGDAVSSPLI